MGGMTATQDHAEHPLFAKHADTLERALTAIAERAYWSAYPESPSPKVYGETAAADGEAAFRGATSASDFPLDQPGIDGLGGDRALAVRHRARRALPARATSTRCSPPRRPRMPAWRDAGPADPGRGLPGDPGPAARERLRAGQRRARSPPGRRS